MTRRRLRPVAPIALSMPRARSLRWAITEKPATDTRPMNTRPSTSTTRTSTAGEIPPDIMLGIATVATAGIPGSVPVPLPTARWTAGEPSSMITWLGWLTWPGATSANSSARLLGSLHHAGHPPGRAGGPPGPAHVRAVLGRDLAGQRDLAGTGRVGAADQAEQRGVVVPVRILGTELHRLGAAVSDVLILNDIGWTPATRNGGDVGGQLRVAAG